ncbi:MAG: choice-of-anchor L domain-containing protein [Bacteroidia bacterium]
MLSQGKKHILLFFVLAFASLTGYAQLTVSPNGSASTLVNTIVGPGVTVLNPSLNCNGQAAGTFNASGTNLGITSGIILSTGTAVHASGSNTDDGSSDNSGCFASNGNSNFFDPELNNIEPLATYDGCVLEFDIKPVCSVLNINYVFASEEYPEFVCSDFNDVFGFFISGPNPAGGSYANTNIAEIPGTGIPVQINSINGGSVGSSSGSNPSCVSLGYSNYYVDNSGGSSIQYDGFTVPLVAAANVTPCAVYHIKLAIADAGDCYYDSGVFLAYHGLTCPQSQVPSITGASTPVNCVNDGSATVNVQNSPGPVTYSWAPGGQTTPNISNLTAGVYTCTVGFTVPCPYTQKIYITVTNQNVLTLSASSTNSYCGSPTGTASATANGGVPPYSSFSWSTVPVQNTATATQLSPGTYTVSVTDNNGCTVSKPVTVGNTVPVITFNDSIIDATCMQPNGDIFVKRIVGGTSPYTFNWSSSPPQTSQALNNAAPGTYTFIVTDANNCKDSASFTIGNLSNIPLSSGVIDEHCFHQNGSATVSVLNGTAPYSYSWSHDPSLNSPTASNLGAGHYIVTVTDAVGCMNINAFDLVNVNDVFDGSIYTTPAEPNVNQPFELILSNSPNWTLNYVLLPDGSISTSAANTLMYEQYGYYHSNFYVTSANNCIDTIDYEFFVKDFMTVYIPNAFTPNGDLLNPVWFVYGTLVKEIHIYVFDRWGNKFFESDSLERGWDGTVKGAKAPEDVYVYKVVAKDYYGEVYTYNGTVSLIR